MTPVSLFTVFMTTQKLYKVKKKSAKTDDAVNILPYIYAFLAAGLALSCTGRRRKTQ